jgi:PTH2 family peptidyl-tRNA hydrolase
MLKDYYNGGVHVKQAIVVRKDLKMDCGKIAGQVAHASLRSYKISSIGKKYLWKAIDNEVKVILKVNSGQELAEIMYKCEKSKIKYAQVRDMGKTQIQKGTLTCIGLEIRGDSIIDEIVGHLKLL